MAVTIKGTMSHLRWANLILAILAAIPPLAHVLELPNKLALDGETRDFARSLAGTPAFEQSRRERKRVEMLFAHLKRILRMGRLRLRGPNGARTEFLLAATVQNLRKLAKLVPVPSSQIAAAT